MGIDFPAIRALPGIETGFMRHLNGYRWNIHFGRPESSADFINYDFDNEEVKLLRETGGLEFLIDFEVYFETFFNAPLKKYSCYFQSANGKPIGRHYLKELSFDVGALDARNIMIGAQPLSAHGVEDESRDFAHAFCALPALPFQKVPGDTDPVVVRSLSTQNGTYFYAVNMSYFPVGVKLDFGKRKTLGLFGGERYTDLSTGTDHSSDTIGLLPFQLRSFLSANQGLRIASAVVAGRSREADEYFAGRLALLETAASTLEEHNVSCQEQRLAIARIRDEVACGHWAERPTGVRPAAQKMLRDCDDIANIAERQRLIDQGTYRVNFGCFTFNRFNDLLFFSDQMYTGKNLYGCVANAFKSCTRDITGIQGAAIPDLFQTEAYDVDGCRFKLPDGQYTVTLFLKCGFRPGFKPGKFVFNMAINGAPPENSISTSLQGDFKQALELVPRDPLHACLRSISPCRSGCGQSAHDSTARTLNAIVTPGNKSKRRSCFHEQTLAPNLTRSSARSTSSVANWMFSPQCREMKGAGRRRLLSITSSSTVEKTDWLRRKTSCSRGRMPDRPPSPSGLREVRRSCAERTGVPSAHFLHLLPEPGLPWSRIFRRTRNSAWGPRRLRRVTTHIGGIAVPQAVNARERPTPAERLVRREIAYGEYAEGVRQAYGRERILPDCICAYRHLCAEAAKRGITPTIETACSELYR